MEEPGPQKLEMLKFVHQSLHETSLQHRQNIFNTFSLSTAGLMVILGGVLSADGMTCNFKWLIGVAVCLVCTLMVFFMSQQCGKSEDAMKIMRKIERELKLGEKDSYLSGESVLPEHFYKPPKTCMGLTCGDWLQAGPLIILALAIIFALILLPTS